MFKWLADQGESHSRGGADEGSPDYSNLQDDVAKLVSIIMRPYMVGSRGRCVLGLLLR
jgi:hypothetical protein